MITHLPTGKKYIGRKYFNTFQKDRKTDRRKKKPSDWESYWGSNDTILEMIKSEGTADFTRDILTIYETKGGVNYGEVKEQFERRVKSYLDLLLK